MAFGKSGGKFVIDRQNHLAAIALGKAAATKPADPESAVRAHVAALQQLGAKTRGS